MSGPSAEIAYLFRHALLRDAAYSLQLPSDRARLHELAFYLIEQAFGGRAPEPPPLDAINPPEFVPHATDRVAAELAYHGQRALEPGTGAKSACPWLLYLRRAAEVADQQFRPEAESLWLKLAEQLQGAACGEAIRSAGWATHLRGRPHIAERHMDQALAIHREVGNRRGEGLALGNLAIVYQETGRVELAERT